MQHTTNATRPSQHNYFAILICQSVPTSLGGLVWDKRTCALLMQPKVTWSHAILTTMVLSVLPGRNLSSNLYQWWQSRPEGSIFYLSDNTLRQIFYSSEYSWRSLVRVWGRTRGRKARRTKQLLTPENRSCHLWTELLTVEDKWGSENLVNRHCEDGGCELPPVLSDLCPCRAASVPGLLCLGG